MSDKIKINTLNSSIPENILQKININKIPILILLLILIIAIFIILLRGYFTFRKLNIKQGFENPNNDNQIPRGVGDIKIPEDIRNNKIPDQGGGSGDSINSNKNLINNEITNKKIDDKDIDKYIDKYRDQYPNQYDKYKDQYDKYKDLNDKFKKSFDSSNKFFGNVKKFQSGINEKYNQLKEYKNKFTNFFSSGFNDTNKKIKGVFVNKNTSILNDKKVSNPIIIGVFIIIVVILCFSFLPSFKDFKTLFNQISNVTYVILYTIFIILFFRLLPSDILNNNAYFIVPITMIIAFILFIISFQNNYIVNFNINYERIKIIILYFCFITLCITYYTINPGQYITKNFNISLLISSLFGLFGFLYLIVLLTFNNSYENLGSSKNALDKFSSFSKYGSIFFIIFLIIITSVIATYPGGFFNDKGTSTAVIIILPFICILWGMMLIINFFSDSNNNSKGNKQLIESKFATIKKTFLVLLGISISGIIIAYITFYAQNIPNKSNIPSFILSLFLIISVLILIYKTIFVTLPSSQMNNYKNSFFDLLINVLFYIPCIFSGIFDKIMKLFISEYNSNSPSTFLILIGIILLIIGYFYIFPLIQNSFNKQGGKQLVENPINTNVSSNISSYQQLNGKDTFDYQYGLSFWLFIESLPPNTNSNYNKFTSVLNYGGKPNILYKADTNTLMITIDQEQLSKKTNNKLIEYDENGNRIVYINNNFLLQKWNNIIINYNGGTLDIFLNGELVKSSIEVIPYMKYDTLTIGSNNGINGGICNVVYYKNPLNLTKIYYIYNNLKDKNVPVVNYFNKTIIS